MIENKRALPLNRLDGPESALNIKQDNNSPVCESQPVEKFCLARALWPHVKARREARKLLDAQIAAGEVQP
jgi:hypothetical protein